MNLELTDRQYRYLLDLVYIGNWVINSTRGNDRIKEYDQVESRIFSHCLISGKQKLVEWLDGEIIPSLMNRPPGKSMLNPYDVSQLSTFNLFYVFVGIFSSVFK